MDDFASSAMMRLVALGLKQQGIKSVAPSSRSARIPRASKRDALAAVMAAQGAGAILRISDVVPELPPDPLVQALIRARSTTDLFDRWHRMERFAHGRHEVQITETASGVFALRHVARDGGVPPTPPETLLVLGVLTRLAEIVTASSASLQLSEGSSLRHNGQWATEFDIKGLTRAILTCRGETASDRAPTETAGSASENVRIHLRRDPVMRWHIEDITRPLATSRRTLQRRLKSEGTSFSGLLTDVRLETAAALLVKPNGPSLAGVGFLSGFSDQPHFNRIFKREIGTTPAGYRRDFAY